MSEFPGLALHLAVALGIGLLIGAERERRKGQGPFRSPAGIRTFALASLSGAVSLVLGGPLLLAVAFFGFLLLAFVAYLRTTQQDPGLTSETALGLTVLLGGLAVQEPSDRIRTGGHGFLTSGHKGPNSPLCEGSPERSRTGGRADFRSSGPGGLPAHA
jgi:hypothetical protein